MRGLQIDRLLLTTNTTYIPTGFGPAESSRIATQTTLSTTITRTIVYTYDDLYRLTNANYSTGELFAYTYDPAGNRKSQTTLAGTNVYTYDAANRLTQVDGQSYTWDNNGNLLNDGVRAYGYDAANRLTSLIQGGTTTQFMYNGDGDRLAQIINGLATSYALDPTGLAQVLVESQNGQKTHYLPGLAEYDTAWAYYLPDRLGNLRQLTNNSGQVALAQSYDPFGNLLEQTGNGQSIFGYTGEQMDPTGLVFLRARYYTWQPFDHPEGYSISAMNMLNTNEGWFISQEGILHYQNGQWQIFGNPARDSMRSLVIINENEGWAVGYGILHYTNQ